MKGSSVIFAVWLIFDSVTMAIAAEGPAAGLVATPRPLTLTEAVALFNSRNPDLVAARHTVESARAATLVASQKPNPTLSFNSTNISTPSWSSAGRYWDKHLDNVVRLDQPFERGHKRELRQDAANAALAASQDDLIDTRRQLLTALYAGYYDLLLAQEKDRINRESVDLYDKSLAALERRLKAGDISPADVTRLRVEALKSRNDVRQTEADLEKARLTLAYLIGAETDPQSRSIVATDSWPAFVSPDAMAPTDEIIAARADVRAARERVGMTDKNRRLALALRKRDVTVGVQYEHYPPDSGNTYGIGVSIPLFTGYAYEGEIRGAENDYLAALDNLEKIKAQAITEIAKARADLESASDRLKRYDDELLPQAWKAKDAAEFAYEHGALGVLDLIDARRTLHAVTLDAATARNDYAKALAAWSFAAPLPDRND